MRQQRREYAFGDSSISGGGGGGNESKRGNVICYDNNNGNGDEYNSTLGCWLMNPGMELPGSRAQIDTLFGQPGTQPHDIRIAPYDAHGSLNGTQSGDKQYSGQPGNRLTRMSAIYGDYPQGPRGSYSNGTGYNGGPNLYEQPIFDSEDRMSTGVMVNTYTGQMYEMFEDDMPPPNLSVSRQFTDEQLSHTNPFLIYAQGGADPNRDDPNKTEVLAYQPDESDGPNVWGDQLYADRRRSELEMRAARDIWMNKHGTYSVESVDDRRPVGYVGFQPAYRMLPYLPATQRMFLESNFYTGPAQDVVPDAVTQAMFRLDGTHLKGYETVSVGYTGNANAAGSGAFTEPQVEQNIRLNSTNRQWTGVSQIPAAIGGNGETASAGYVVVDREVRDTLKAEGEQMFPVKVIQQTHDGSNAAYVVIDKTLRDTLKIEGEYMFPVVSASASDHSQQQYVVIDRSVRDTLKTQNELMFPIKMVELPDGSTASYVVLDKKLRDTLKTQSELPFQVSSVQYNEALGGTYVIIDRKYRDTLKTQSEVEFNTAPIYIDGNTGSYVVIDRTYRDTLKTLQETNYEIMPVSFDQAVGGYVVSSRDIRDTLKVNMEHAFSSSNVSAADFLGDYVVLDRKVRDTLKANMESSFEASNIVDATDILMGGGGNYVLSDRHARDTMKTLLEDMFKTTGAGSEGTGTYITFQGEILPTSRMYYEAEGSRPSIDAAVANEVHTMIRTAQSNILNPHRGAIVEQDLDYVYAPSRVLADTGDTSTRYIGHQERVANREQCGRYFAPVKIVQQDERVVPLLQVNNSRGEFCGENQGESDFSMNYIHNITMPVEQMQHDG